MNKLDKKIEEIEAAFQKRWDGKGDEALARKYFNIGITYSSEKISNFLNQ